MNAKNIFKDDTGERIAPTAWSKFTIPDEWETYSLGEVCSIQTGNGFESEHFNSEGEGWPLIKRATVNGTEDEPTYTTEEFNDRYIIEEGDVLVSMDGNFEVKIWSGPTSALNQRVCKITPQTDKIDTEYLGYVLQPIIKHCECSTGGTTVPSLSNKQLKKINIPVPPVGEQERIVSLLSDVDEYIEKTSERVHALEQQKQAVLQRVFKKHTEVDDNQTLEDYGISFVKGKTPVEENGNIPYLSTGVYRDNDEPEDYTIEEEATVVSQDDIVMIMDGSNSGEVFSGQSGAISSTMAKIEFEKDIYKPYVKALLEWFYPHINANTMGSTIPHTSKKVVSRLPVFHTTRERQKEIAEVVTKLNREKSKTQEEIKSMRELKQGLLQEIFSG